MTPVEIGTRFFLWKRTVVVEEYLANGRGEYAGQPMVRVHPLDAKGKREPRKTLPHVDYVTVHRLNLYGTQLADGEVRTVEQASLTDTLTENAKPKRAASSPKKRLGNRIAWIRWRMANPEKNGREAWTPEELADFEAKIEETVAELAALEEVAA